MLKTWWRYTVIFFEPERISWWKTEKHIQCITPREKIMAFSIYVPQNRPFQLAEAFEFLIHFSNSKMVVWNFPLKKDNTFQKISTTDVAAQTIRRTKCMLPWKEEHVYFDFNFIFSQYWVIHVYLKHAPNRNKAPYSGFLRKTRDTENFVYLLERNIHHEELDRSMFHFQERKILFSYIPSNIYFKLADAAFAHFSELISRPHDKERRKKVPTAAGTCYGRTNLYKGPAE